MIVMSAFPQKRISATNDFYDFIHPTKRMETVILWDKTRSKGAWTCVDPKEDITNILDGLNYMTDIYFSPNEFYKWRLGKNLRRLTSFYVDVDCRNLDNLSRSDYNDYIINILQNTLKKINDLNIPSPNCVVYTGRGYHLYWRFEPVGAKCLPRWKAVMKRLIEVIDNADPACTDATRMMRLPNTYNSKNGALSDIGFLCDDDYTFDDLCNQILPHTRSEIRDFRAARAKRGLEIKKKTAGQRGRGSIYERWYLVYQDVQKLIVHHFTKNKSESVPEGMRDRLLFHAANALSWFTHKEALESEVKELAAKYFGSLELSKCLAYCSSVLKRASNTKAGEEGELRYKYKSETLYDELQDLIPSELRSHMRALVSSSMRKDKKAAAQRAYRQNRGAVSRSEYQSNIEKRKREAEKLAKRGMTKSTIAEKLGVSLSTVKNYLRKVIAKPTTKEVGASDKNQGSKSVSLYSGRSPELFVSISVAYAVGCLQYAWLRFFPLNKSKNKAACPAGQRYSQILDSS